eukprot:scpid55440/ scgid10404/ Pleckstrin homology domain-containing family G member 1
MSQSMDEECLAGNTYQDGNAAAGDSQARVPKGWRMVIRELVETERTYVTDLSDVIRGYYEYLPGYYKPRECCELPMSAEERDLLFSNLGDLVQLNASLLGCFENASGRPEQIAACFLDREEEFKIYAQYCINYVQAMDTFNLLLKRPRAEEYFQHCQLTLGHTLPLDSFLLKPVQRILKYPLLLNSLIKQYTKFHDLSEEIRQLLLSAHMTMSNLAQYINEVKQAKEESKRTEEILSQIIGWESPADTGNICVEDQARVYGTKGEHHHLYAFQKTLLITKPIKDGPELYRRHLPFSDITLADVSADPFLFELHCPSEQEELSPRAMRLFPIVVCPRNAKQKAVWLKTLRERDVADVTVEIETVRHKTFTTGEQSSSGSSAQGLSRPRHSFIQVIAQVQRAASINSYSASSSNSGSFHNRIDSKCDNMASVNGEKAGRSVDEAPTDRKVSTLRKWDELVTIARQASLEKSSAERRNRNQSLHIAKDKVRSPNFWRKAHSSTEKGDELSSTGDVCSTASSEIDFSKTAPSSLQLSLPVMSTGSVSSAVDTTQQRTVEQCESTSALDRDTLCSPMYTELAYSLPACPTQLESPTSPGLPPLSPLSSQRGTRARTQIKDALKTAGKLMTPRRLHTPGSSSHSEETPVSPTNKSHNQSLRPKASRSVGAQVESSFSGGGSNARQLEDSDSVFSVTQNHSLSTTGTQTRSRVGSISFNIPSWATSGSSSSRSSSTSSSSLIQKVASRGKRVSAPSVMKLPESKLEPFQQPREKPTSRLGRLAERTRERRNTVANYCRKAPESLPGSTDVF